LDPATWLVKLSRTASVASDTLASRTEEALHAVQTAGILLCDWLSLALAALAIVTAAVEFLMSS